MPKFKKLILAPIFLLFFALTIYQFSPFLKSYELIFSLSLNTLIQLIIISAFILLSSFSYVLFSSFSLDYKFVLPVGILASVIPFLFLEPALGIVFMVGVTISLLLTFLNLEATMKNYLNFQPNTLFGPATRHLCTLIVLILSIVYFLSINKVISEKGFSLPDSLIDTAINFAQPQQSSSQFSLSQVPQNLAQDFIKQTVKDQVQSFIKPYLGFVPAILSLLLFFTLQSLTSILSLLLSPLLWITFYILEKSGFVKFTQEMRPVKKMVI